MIASTSRIFDSLPSPATSHFQDSAQANECINFIKEQKASGRYAPDTPFDDLFSSLVAATSLKAWRSPEYAFTGFEELNPYMRAIGKIIDPLFSTYANKKKEVLEIGSGCKPFMEFLPDQTQETKDRIHLSDVNLHAIDYLKKNYPDNAADCLDIQHIPLKPPPPTYRTIVMNDVFNVFSAKELKKTCDGIYRLLEPGGHLISFCIRESFYNHTMDTYKDRSWVYFPDVDKNGTWTGIHLFKRQVFAKAVESLAADDDLSKQLLKEIADLSGRDRSLFFITSVKAPNQSGWLAMIASAAAKLKTTEYEKLNFEEEFQKRLKSALQKQKFIIKLFKEIGDSYVGERTASEHFAYPDKHYFSINRQNRTKCFLGVLPQGKILEQAVVFAVVCQKPYD